MRSIWEPDSPTDDALHITYKDLHGHVCKFANVLKDMGVGKGDRVVIYMPMIPQAAYAMLACARIGAIHSIVFAGFSPDALSARVNGSEAKVVITADEAPRGGRNTPLKVNADKAFEKIELRAFITFPHLALKFVSQRFQFSTVHAFKIHRSPPMPNSSL